MPISYEKLDAGRRSTELVCEIYQVSRLLPVEERFGLTTQIRRATVSVTRNIAEGWGRHGTRELLHHMSMARGSLKEVETLLYLIGQLCFAQPAQLEKAKELCPHVSRLLFGMRRKLSS